MLIFGTLSLLASFVLSRDALLLAADPTVELACSVNSTFDCADVSLSWQAQVFGFPNAFLGLISEPVVMTIGVLGLCRVRMPRWFMLTANALYALGFVFAYWLLWQSTMVIGALCPWCLLVTFSTTMVLHSMTALNARAGHLGKRMERFTEKGWLTISLIAWLAVVVVFEVGAWLL